MATKPKGDISQKKIEEIGLDSHTADKPKVQKSTEFDVDNLCRRHLKVYKVIRDSVHGDIWLTELEIKIIDTPIFQRLRRIKQLGPTDLVYPSAKHTRFDHSIGTLYVAQQIIDSINKNYENGLSYFEISQRDTIVIRILALIHDLAHLPFGHTIEDEGKLFEKKQWRDDKRFNYVWGIIQPIIESHLIDLPASEKDKIIEDLKAALKAEEGDKDDNIHILKRPFIADIVGNTICADLLDYIKRDAYNTGLKMIYDPRILSYFVLVTHTKEIEQTQPKGENKKKKVDGIRAAILLEKKPGKIKNDILNYCVDLLRMRYSLAEKSHFHRVKCIASAMVIKMIFCALEAEMITYSAEDPSIRKNNLMHLCDDTLIYTILCYEDKDHINEFTITAKKMASKLFNRELYKDIYPKNYTDESTYDSLIKYSNKKTRYDKERDLEIICGLDPGSIVIYCPEMQSGKMAETKILRYNKSRDKIVKTLKELAREDNYNSTIGQELETLERLYKRLWNFYILIDKKCIQNEQHEEIIKNVCQEFFEADKLGNHAVILRDFLLNGELNQNQIYNITSELATAKEPREVKDKIGWIDNKILVARSKR
jgi:uncharacterized protein